MKAGSAPSGLLLLYKETGCTSFDALWPVKRAVRSGKAGHTGTLDKFASGLLAILLGRALKLTPLFLSCDKEYEAEIRFGIETDTLDPEGSQVAVSSPPSRERFEEILPQFTGEILQTPPVYSALHINGKRAYELARSGKAPEMKKRPVVIKSLTLENWSPPFASIRVRCSSGTYIRSLARDLALACGSCAHLAALCRTKIGGFSLENAFRFRTGNHLNCGTDDTGDKKLYSSIQAIMPGVFESLGIPYIFIDSEEEKQITQGKALGFLESRLPYVPVTGLFSTNTRELSAVLEYKDGIRRYSHVFA
jgi:tRNA pseudouridine55 synthase